MEEDLEPHQEGLLGFFDEIGAVAQNYQRLAAAPPFS